MKFERTDRDTVPQDGSIRLKPGAWLAFHIDTPVNPGFHDLNAWLRSVRGFVLSEVFSLENDLILLRLADEFGTVDHGTAAPEFFNREQALREDHSLKRKIDAAKPIIRRLFDLLEADRLVQDLAICREVRNLMAHYPSWQEPVNDEASRRTVALKLYIADRHHVWQLDEADVAGWMALMIRVRRQLIRLRNRCSGLAEPDFIDDQSVIIKGPASDS